MSGGEMADRSTVVTTAVVSGKYRTRPRGGEDGRAGDGGGEVGRQRRGGRWSNRWDETGK